jgi:hypothetical protein
LLTWFGCGVDGAEAEVFSVEFRISLRVLFILDGFFSIYDY